MSNVDFILCRYSKKLYNVFYDQALRNRKVFWFVKNKRYASDRIVFLETHPYAIRTFAYYVLSCMYIVFGYQGTINVFTDDFLDLVLYNYTSKVNVYFVNIGDKDVSFKKLYKVFGLLPFFVNDIESKRVLNVAQKIVRDLCGVRS